MFSILYYKTKGKYVFYYVQRIYSVVTLFITYHELNVKTFQTKHWNFKYNYFNDQTYRKSIFPKGDFFFFW